MTRLGPLESSGAACVFAWSAFLTHYNNKPANVPQGLAPDSPSKANKDGTPSPKKNSGAGTKRKVKDGDETATPILSKRAPKNGFRASDAGKRKEEKDDEGAKAEPQK